MIIGSISMPGIQRYQQLTKDDEEEDDRKMMGLQNGNDCDSDVWCFNDDDDDDDDDDVRPKLCTGVVNSQRHATLNLIFIMSFYQSWILDIPIPEPKDFTCIYLHHLGVSKNRGFTPKSSILIGFSLINHPFWGTIIFGNTHFEAERYLTLFSCFLNFLLQTRHSFKK